MLAVSWPLAFEGRAIVNPAWNRSTWLEVERRQGHA